MAPHGDEMDMDMGASMDMGAGMTMDMGTGTTAAATTGTMAGMDMSNGTTMTMSMMMSVFQNSMSTPLYTTAWTPNSVGTYAATCIFLICLGAILRGLLAAKAIQESRWLDRELNRRFVAVQGKLPIAEQVSRDSLGKRMTLTENGVEEDVMVVKKRHTMVRPWRLSVDPIRAVIDTIIAAVGYLL
jgi:hypothetical protein